MKIDRTLEAVICHEWGHVLAFVIFGGNVDDIDGVIIENSLLNCDGHTIINPLCKMPTDRKILMLFGGIAAENICKYSRAFIHAGTDADKLNAIASKQAQREAKAKVLEALTPYKRTLQKLTADTIDDIKRGDSQTTYYRVFKDVLRDRLNTARGW